MKTIYLFILIVSVGCKPFAIYKQHTEDKYSVQERENSAEDESIF